MARIVATTVHRPLTHTFLGSLALLACAREPPASMAPEPAYRAPALDRKASVSPKPVVEARDEWGEIESWLGCHPYEVASFEFAEGDHRAVSPASEAEFERLVTHLKTPPAEGPIAKILIIGRQSSNESLAINDLRAATLREALIEAGAESSLLLAAGFDVPPEYYVEDDSGYRNVTVFEVCYVCCLL